MTDTAAKRAAALGAGLTPGVLLPTPDGSVDQIDRAQLVGVYASEQISPEVVTVPPSSRTVRVRMQQ